jgi:hypothetical protein
LVSRCMCLVRESTMALEFSDWLASFLYPLLVITNLFNFLMSVGGMYPRLDHKQFSALHAAYVVAFTTLALTTGRWPLADFEYFRVISRLAFALIALIQLWRMYQTISAYWRRGRVAWRESTMIDVVGFEAPQKDRHE